MAFLLGVLLHAAPPNFVEMEKMEQAKAWVVDGWGILAYDEEKRWIFLTCQMDKTDKMTDGELELIVEEFKKELKCFNHYIGK